MDDEQITEALAEVGAAWLMDDDDEHSQANAIRHVVAAAIAAEREACAKVADAVAAAYPDSTDSWDAGYKCAGEKIAAAIRALASTAPATPPEPNDV